MASSLGVILNSINNKGTKLDRDFIESEYVPFVVNRSLSYFVDTALFAAELDRIPKMDKWDQYLYYYICVPKCRRFQSWHRSENDKYLKAVAEVYNYSYIKAKTALKLLDKSQCVIIEKMVDKGGK